LRHGPLAVIEPGMPVLFFISRGRSFGKTNEQREEREVRLHQVKKGPSLPLSYDLFFSVCKTMPT
jgi:hypothetical protein